MRALLVLALSGLALAALPAGALAQDPEPLRLNDVQARGTHNSFHRDPAFPGREFAGWGYSHAPLDHQLEDGDVRQIELDVHYNWARDEFEVYHAWFGDDRTTCEALRDCLEIVKGFSDAHPAHLPILVMVEFKDNGPPKNTELPENGDPFTREIAAAEYGKLDRELLAPFGAGRVITPDDVRAPGLSLRDTITTQGWPALDSVRGQVMFLVDGDDHSEAYSAGWTSLAGRTLFVQAPDGAAVAAFVGRDGARLPGESKYDRMARVVGAGFMLRDLSDPGSFAQAKAGGAHFVSSDDPDRLQLGDDPLAPARCNPVSAPATCTDRAIETHAEGDWTAPSPDPSDGVDQVAKDKAERLGCGSGRSVAALATGSDPGCPVSP